MRARVPLLLVILLGAVSPALAHEIRPAFLQIQEVEPSIYDIRWKTPAQGDMRLALNVLLPRECKSSGPPRTTRVAAAAVQRWRISCAGGLPGKRIVIENLPTSLTDVILRFEALAAPAKTLHMDGAAPYAVIPAQQSTWEVAGAYSRLGIEHILFGFDHLLFVLCLLILLGDLKRLIAAVTAFSVAHSITLAGTTLGWLRLASAPVEACIALSIAFVAAEILRARTGRVGLTQRWPWLASFSFGLLHGCGFAAALREIGLPEGTVPLALFFFNVGVEAGQILFLATVLAALALWRRYAPPPAAWMWRALPYLAGITACFWFIERTLRILLV